MQRQNDEVFNKLLYITENGKRKTENFCFSVFAWSEKTEPTNEAMERGCLQTLSYKEEEKSSKRG